MAEDWWQKPRKISVVVDNDSWILPYAQAIVAACNENGDDAVLCRTHDEITEGAIAFYLGCVKITPPEVLARNKRNLVVHASDLPKGRGFSPWTWLVLEGEDKIPVCLIEAEEEVDSGDIYYKDWMELDGTELVDDLRGLIGKKTEEFALRFLASEDVLQATKQEGEKSIYARRRPEDSRLDPDKTLSEQINLLRVVDNDNYPAFFEHKGQRYIVKIEKENK